MKKFRCIIEEGITRKIEGEAIDLEEFLLYLPDLQKNQPRLEVLLPQRADGSQITNDPDHPPYKVVIEYTGNVIMETNLIRIIPETLEEVTDNVKLEIPT